jgi:hypothetical protein
MIGKAAALVRLKGLAVSLSVVCLAIAAALVVVGTLIAGG